MIKEHAQSGRDSRLWRRILLVGSTGALPLFFVSLLLISVAYGDALEFGLQERRGNAFEGRVERLLEVLPGYQLAAQRGAGPETNASKREIEAALDALARAGESEELGRALGFANAGPEAESLRAVRDKWQALAREPLSVVASGEGTSQVAEAARAVIQRIGDRSNLILDHDLDSYYLMDITLGTLPRLQQRMLEVRRRVAAWREGPQPSTNAVELAVAAALLREEDLGRIQQDARRSLREDANFNGKSPTLAPSLEPAVERFSLATERLLALLDRMARGDSVATDDFDAAANAAWAQSFALFRHGSAELDRLLAIRVSATRGKRLRAYLLIVATLLSAALVMGVLMRGLLAARYAEILKSQAELRSKEQQLRALGDNLPGMTYQVMRDFDGSMRFLYVSAGVERLHGVSSEAVLADASLLYERILPEDRPALLRAERESSANKTPFRMVARSLRTDGAVRFLEFASAPRELPDGRTVWDGIQLDVTDRQTAELAVRQSEQRFSCIFDGSPIPMTLSSLASGKYVAVNDSFLRLGGFDREEVIGHTPLELGIYENASAREPILAQLRQHGHLHAHEHVFRGKAGTLRDTVMWINVLRIGGEELVLVMALDVTEQKTAARQQKALEEQLRQTQRLEALGTLAGGIAHDFNNILGAIISYSELAKLDNPDNQPLVGYLDQVLLASQRATILVRQILSFSRQQKETQSNLQLAPICKEALSLLRATLPTTVTLRAELDTELPDVLANPTQVHQIVMNLCTNAAYAMKGRHGELSVRLAEARFDDDTPAPHVELAPGDYVRLTISDTGHGMDAATAQRIFEPFFTTKAAGEGTGLGLSVVHGIVNGYGGTITVDSELERGTTFDIYLPACPASTVPISEPAAAIPRGNGERVLYVDDEAVLGDVAQKMMQRLGYEAVVFQRSEAALAAFRRDPHGFDVLITDLTMPVLTGDALIREVLAIRPSFPVLLISGSSGPLSNEAVRKLGVQDVLSKPLGYRGLANALQQVLSRTARSYRPYSTDPRHI
jgi:PAS domain S-box-containing protein